MGKYHLKPTLTRTEWKPGKNGRMVKRKFKVPVSVLNQVDISSTAEAMLDYRKTEEALILMDGRPKIDLCDDVPTNAGTAETRRQRRHELWARASKQFVVVWTEGEAVWDDKCSKCQHQAAKIIHCPDCAYGKLYCETCYTVVHQQLLWHEPLVWTNGSFVQIASRFKVLERYDNHSKTCSTLYKRNLNIVDGKGREHCMDVEFCQCESNAETLLRHRLWPASPEKPQTGFAFELMEWLRCLRLEAHTSLYSVANAIKLKNQIGTFDPGENLFKHYRTLTEDCFEEYVEFKKRASMQLDISDLTTEEALKCPACVDSSQSTGLKPIISADANFGLVRKWSAGNAIDVPTKDFFLNQAEVDSFLASYHHTSVEKEKDCSNFQAGNHLRGKKKSKHLDEKGIFGMICRHEIPLSFCNIKHDGERFGYIVHMMTKLTEHSNQQQSILMYDVGCLLKKHLMKSIGHKSLLEHFQLILPVFHAFGHSKLCQVEFGPLMTTGVGLSDGEGMERLWSYLRKFSGMTKVMTPDHRASVLSQAITHYAQKGINNIVKRLHDRLQRASKVESNADEILQPLLQLTDADVSDLKEYASSERNLLKGNSDGGRKKRDKYILELNRLYSMRSDITRQNRDDEFERLDASLKEQEKKARITRLRQRSKEFGKRLATEADRERNELKGQLEKENGERKWLLGLIRKYADGQAVYKKINASLTKSQRKIKKFTEKYNQLKDLPTSSNVPLTITELPDETIVASESGTRQQMAELVARIDRCQEEKQMIAQEAKNIWQQVTTDISAMDNLLQGIQGESQVDRGRIARIQLHLACLEIKRSRIFQHFPEVSEAEIEMPYCIKLGWITAPQTNEYCDGDNDEDFECSEESDSELDDDMLL